MDGAAPPTRFSAAGRPALAGVRNDRARRRMVDSHAGPWRQRADCVTVEARSRGVEGSIFVGAAPVLPGVRLALPRACGVCPPKGGPAMPRALPVDLRQTLIER